MRPQFNNNYSYNNLFRYKDTNAKKNTKFFKGVAINCNTIQFADGYGTVGTALWRLVCDGDWL